MATYLTLADTDGAGLVVTEQNLADADVYVNLALQKRGFTQAEIATITLPNATLTAIASAWAKSLAANDGIVGENPGLSAKAKNYANNAQTLVDSLTREALGLTTGTGSGFGNITIGRA